MFNCGHDIVHNVTGTPVVVDSRRVDVAWCSTCREIVARIVHESGIELTDWQPIRPHNAAR